MHHSVRLGAPPGRAMVSRAWAVGSGRVASAHVTADSRRAPGDEADGRGQERGRSRGFAPGLYPARRHGERGHDSRWRRLGCRPDGRTVRRRIAGCPGNRPRQAADVRRCGRHQRVRRPRRGSGAHDSATTAAPRMLIPAGLDSRVLRRAASHRAQVGQPSWRRPRRPTNATGPGRPGAGPLRVLPRATPARSGRGRPGLGVPAARQDRAASAEPAAGAGWTVQHAASRSYGAPYILPAQSPARRCPGR